MKNIYLNLVILLIGCTYSFGQNEEQIFKSTLESWSELNSKITFTNFTIASVGNVRGASADAIVNGIPCKLAVEYTDSIGKSFVSKVYFTFTKGYKIPPDFLSTIIGVNPLDAIPTDLNSGLQLDNITLKSDSKSIIYGGISFSNPSWGSIGENNLSLTDINGTVAILDPSSKNKNVYVSLGGSLQIPKDVSDYLKLTTTKLDVSGTVDTKEKEFFLRAKLDAAGTPIGDQNAIKFNDAYIELAVKKDKNNIKDSVNLRVGGTLQLDPPNDTQKFFKGDLSINLNGKFFGQAWMVGSWNNPFGLSKELYVSNVGLGFGIDFTKPPFPLPIVGLQGQLTVGAEDIQHAKFGGRATLGYDAGDPTQNMIDVEDITATLGDIVSVFYTDGTPNTLKETLNKIKLSNGRLSIVPPGKGVELFGNQYNPGVSLGATFTFDDSFTGVLKATIKDSLVLAFGGMSKIDFPGLSITNYDSTGGPNVFVYIPKADLLKSAFGIDGKINVLGIESKSSIYASDAGFSFTTEGKILNTFDASLELAGADLLDSGSLYVKATMKNDLFDKIGNLASEHMEEAITATDNKIAAAKADLNLNRPLLEAAKTDYETTKATVIQANIDGCNKWNELKVSQASKQAELDAIMAQIAQANTDINSLNTKINNNESKATLVHDLTCPSGSFHDAIDPSGGLGVLGSCWTCPSGYSRTIGIDPVNGNRACYKPAYDIFQSATKQGDWQQACSFGFCVTIPFSCPDGTISDPEGTCWYNPGADWHRTALSIHDPHAWYKTIPESYTGATMVKNLNCTGSSLYDPGVGTTAGCWSCPSGMNRTGSPVYSIDACSTQYLAGFQADYIVSVANRDIVLQSQAIAITALTDINNSITDDLVQACKEVSSSELVNADPRVAPKLATYLGYVTSVDGFQAALDAAQTVADGTLKEAAFIAKNVGKVVNITNASFTACLSKAKDGKVALDVKGYLAGNPIDVSLDIDLLSPDEFIKRFADVLLNTKTSTSTFNNGDCVKPNVPKPDLSGTPLEELLKSIGADSNTFPTIPSRPDWAGSVRSGTASYFNAVLISSETDDATNKGVKFKVIAMSDYLDKAKATLIVNGSEIPSTTSSLVSGIASLYYKSASIGTDQIEIRVENGPFEVMLGPVFVANNVIVGGNTLGTGSSLDKLGTIPNPIIFIHGLNSNSKIWEPMSNYLHTNYGLTYGGRMSFCLNSDNNNSTALFNNDYTDFAPLRNDLKKGDFYTVNFDVSPQGFDYGTLFYFNALSNQSAIFKQGRAIRDAIKHVLEVTNSDKVILVGHSMGGLASREYLSSSSIWQNDGKHHVAKLFTTATPHGGSNSTMFGLGIGGLDENSEAVRDLRYSYTYSLKKGAYLFGGQESEDWMWDRLFNKFYNTDVNCNNVNGETITGLNSISFPADISYSCAVGVGSLFEGDGVVASNRANMKNFMHAATPLIFSADTFNANLSKIIPLYFPEFHTKMQEQFGLNMKGLDEPGDFNLAYRIDTGKTYLGFSTRPSQASILSKSIDYDMYKFDLPNTSNVKVSIANPKSDIVFQVFDSNYNLEYAIGVGKKAHGLDTVLQLPSSGSYYLGILTDQFNDNIPNTYSFKINAVSPSDIITVINDSYTEESQRPDNIFIYPNPAENTVNVDAKGNCMLKIRSLLGSSIASMPFESHLAIDVSGYSKGLYLFEVNNGSKIEIRKVVIQ